MLFGLLALYAYVQYALRPRVMLLALAWLLFACSLMAKQTFVTLPFLFLLLDYWPLNRLTGEAAAQKPKPTPGQAERTSNGMRRILLLFVEKLPFLVVKAPCSASSR